MIAIAADTFDRPSETFIRAHVRGIAPLRTVLLCRDENGVREFGCPALTGLRSMPSSRHLRERLVCGLRFRWWRFVDPALRGADERRVQAFFSEHGVRVVLAEYGPNGSLLRVVCKRAGIPLFVHFHGYDATKLAMDRCWRRHYRLLFRDASGFIIPSEFLAGRLRALGCPEEKLYVCPNGVDPMEFEETTRKTGHLVAIGRLVEKKAPHLTIRAFAEVHRRRPNCRLDIVGEGPLHQACLGEIERHGLGHCVRLHGAQGPAYVRELLHNAEIFVQHSVTAHDGDMESFGISIVEAMACSVPVVVTDHNGFSETIVNGETGLLVAEHDVKGMADAIVTLIEDPMRAKAMGLAGRARVEAHFTFDRAAGRLREILDVTC